MSINKFKSFFYFISLLIGCSLIWQWGPLVSVGDYPLLSNPLQRFFAIIIVITLHGLVYYKGKKKLMLKTILATDTHANQENQILHKLQQRFESAIHFLKKTSVDASRHLPLSSQKQLFDLPWFLILGEPNSGKTTLLKQANLKFLLSKKNHSEKNKGLQHCEWFATKEAVFLDVNSHYFIMDKPKKVKAYWLHFINLLKKYRVPAINGIIITIPLDKFSTHQKKTQMRYFRNIQQRIHELNTSLSHAFPVYIVFTKCDCLLGFYEFFNYLSQIELQQLWGISFTREQISTNQQLIDTFDTEFDRLLKKLHERVIYRLHQEQSQQKRTLIKDFPLQMESLKKPITSLLLYLSNMVNKKKLSQLRGIYFTAAHLDNQPIDRLLIPLSSTFALQPYQPHCPHKTQEVFFIHKLLKELIVKDAPCFTDRVNLRENINRVLSYFMVTTAAVLVIAFTLRWSQQFSHQVTGYSQIDNIIENYQWKTKSTPLKGTEHALLALNTLEKMQQILKQNAHPDLVNQLFSMLHLQTHPSLSQLTEKTYHKILQNLITGQLETIITQETNNETSHVELLYGGLKTYLNLSKNPTNKNSLQWLDNYWQNISLLNRDKIAPSVQQHLTSLPPTLPLLIENNPLLIKQAKDKINQLSPGEVILALINTDLINTHPNVLLPIPNDTFFSKQFKIKQNAFIIPRIYTAQQFYTVYEKLIPVAVTQVLEGRNALVPPPSAFNKETLINETRDRYIENYIKQWQNIIDSLQITEFKKIDEIIPFIDSLKQTQSPLGELLNIIKYNTIVTYKNIQTPISIRFQNYNKYFSRLSQGSFVTTKLYLNQLQDLLSPLANAATDRQRFELSFNTAKSRMLAADKIDIFDYLDKEASMAPSPINQWLATIAQNSWTLILNQTANYINKEWQNSVLSDYHKKVKHLYPFLKTAPEEITLTSFNEFFSPNGKLDSFFTHYLSPFLAFNQNRWMTKQRNAQGLPFNEEILTQLTKAYLVKKSFFPNDIQQAKVKFMLKPEALQPLVNRLSIVIDNQQSVITKTKMNNKQFVWPTDQTHHTASLQLKSVQGEEINKHTTGLWAWLRILDQTQVVTTADQKVLNITFDIKGYGARYEMLSEAGPVNPFSPDLLHGFYCPEQLVG